jgi:hypothetical protein
MHCDDVQRCNRSGFIEVMAATLLAGQRMDITKVTSEVDTIDRRDLLNIMQ